MHYMISTVTVVFGNLLTGDPDLILIIFFLLCMMALHVVHKLVAFVQINLK